MPDLDCKFYYQNIYPNRVSGNFHESLASAALGRDDDCIGVQLVKVATARVVLFNDKLTHKQSLCKFPNMAVYIRKTKETDTEKILVIVAQAAEITRLRNLLQPFADAAKYFEPEENEGQVYDDGHMVRDVVEVGDFRRAKKELEK